MNNIIKGLGFLSIVGLVLISLIIGIYSAWVLSVLWSWFLVPLGVKSIGIAHALGLSVIVNIFIIRSKINFAKGIVEKPNLFESLFKGVATSSLALLIGFIITLFM